MDPIGNIVYSSPSCERITGYRPEEFIRDPDLLTQIVHPDHRQLYEEHQRVIHDVSAGPMNIEYRIIARDGSEHWIDHVCRPLFGPDKRYLGRRVSNREITERKQIEESIRISRQNEKKLAQTIRTMEMDIARDLHDLLGQNISFLRMNLDYLSETDLAGSADFPVNIQGMIRAANESHDLIRGMLAIFNSRESDDPVSLFTRYARQTGERASFQVEMKSQGNPKLLSSYQLLQLFYIFREALSNAEKYAQPSQVTIEFIWQEKGLTLIVSDNGCGFDPQNTQPVGHYGLRFMRERASLINGTLSIQSAPGMGTKITVYTPHGENDQNNYS